MLNLRPLLAITRAGVVIFQPLKHSTECSATMRCQTRGNGFPSLFNLPLQRLSRGE